MASLELCLICHNHQHCLQAQPRVLELLSLSTANLTAGIWSDSQSLRALCDSIEMLLPAS